MAENKKSGVVVLSTGVLIAFGAAFGAAFGNVAWGVLAGILISVIFGATRYMKK